MFRRRVTPSFVRRLAGFLWPSLGWKRLFNYLLHRLGRMTGSPHNVAVGLACGAAMSFTPVVGMHILGAVLLATILRGNLVASVIGTAIGNPWTFPMIWTTIYYLGHWMLSGATPAPDNTVDFVSFFTGLTGTLLTLDMARFTSAVLPVFAPMLVGSLPIAVVVWLVFYWLARRLIRQYQDIRGARRRSRGTDRNPTMSRDFAGRMD